MKFAAKIMYIVSVSFFLWFSIVPSIQGHTLHMGQACASAEPMSNFDMTKFLGRWYAIQKTSSSSRCMIYDFKLTDIRKQFQVQQISENGVINVVKKNLYKYRGILETSDDKLPSEMAVKFPLNVLGKASFIVFMTDYDTYAGVYTCQSISFTHRQSATILSRKPTLEPVYVEKVRNRLAAINVNPFDLSIINQTACAIDEKSFTIDINEETFSKDNMKTALKKVGTAVGDGIDFLVKGAKKVYYMVKNDTSDKRPQSTQGGGHRDVEQVEESYIEPMAELL